MNNYLKIKSPIVKSFLVTFSSIYMVASMCAMQPPRKTFTEYYKSGGLEGNYQKVLQSSLDIQEKCRALQTCNRIEENSRQHLKGGIPEDWSTWQELKYSLKMIATIELFPILWLGGRYTYLKTKQWYKIRKATRDRDLKLATVTNERRALNLSINRKITHDLAPEIFQFVPDVRKEIESQYRDKVQSIKEQHDFRNNFNPAGATTINEIIGGIDLGLALTMVLVPIITVPDIATSFWHISRVPLYQMRNATLHQRLNDALMKAKP